MKKLLLLCCLLILSAQAAPDFDHDTKMVKVKIKKVFRFVEDGYSNTAYLVSYKGRDVIAQSFPAGAKTKVFKPGASITIMVQKINMPEQKIRMMQFMVMPDMPDIEGLNDLFDGEVVEKDESVEITPVEEEASSNEPPPPPANLPVY